MKEIKRFEQKVWLSSPTTHSEEQIFIKEAFDTNWVAPLGKNVNEFEDTTGIQVHKFNTLNFEEQMEKYYNDGYTIFMDLNLTGVNAQYFNERNNVQYAREKQQDCREKNKKEEQIWLYTTGASLDASFLYSEFPDNVVEVTNFEDGKAYLDLDTSWELLKDEV